MCDDAHVPHALPLQKAPLVMVRYPDGPAREHSLTALHLVLLQLRDAASSPTFQDKRSLTLALPALTLLCALSQVLCSVQEHSSLDLITAAVSESRRQPGTRGRDAVTVQRLLGKGAREKRGGTGLRQCLYR